MNEAASSTATWPHELFDRLRAAGVSHVSYVPDAGHSTLIRLSLDAPDITTTMLTTEEEGVAVATGAWLGGMRSVILMQSSGVGNCINMLSLPVQSRTPLLMIVTMRGEWAEFNPWQVPMGQATEASLTAIGVHVVRASTGDEVVAAVEQGATMAFEADQQVAVLIGQQLLGEKTW
ncbi:MAG: phosphonopyruvate decarboxylase [Actinomycetia bacterium]|nr:phosphonopyruvate decarboxylase [Actinomycetes bacterium]MCP4958964.1 phosphonopyruvate decarboxylase [Actinomycetes bacterium]